VLRLGRGAAYTSSDGKLIRPSITNRRGEQVNGQVAQMRGGYDLLKMMKDMPELLDTLVRHQTTMIAVGVSAFLLFIGETPGAAQELPTATTDSSGRASIERPGTGGSSNLATAMQSGEVTVSPGQWLIDDVARERAEFEVRQVSPNPLSATNTARDTGYVESAPTLEDGRLGAAPSQRALKRSDGGSPRLDTPRTLDSATKCVEAPVGAAPEGAYWYYRLDRETHRKCWHVQAVRDDRAQRRIVESDRRQSELTSPSFVDWALAWWHGR
jgi:hypothetical protein